MPKPPQRACRALCAWRVACLLLLSAPAGSRGDVVEPTDHWLQHHGIPAWQVVFDHDADGYSSLDEFHFGTDPRDAASAPFRWVSSDLGMRLEIAFTPGIASNLKTSTNLTDWLPVLDRPATETWLAVPVDLLETQRYFAFLATDHPNSDGDCLLDFEELTLYGTNPLLVDTDGDGIGDCDEVRVYFTDPTFNSPTGRGAIQGRVVLDEDSDPATRNHPGVPGWRVYLDLNFNAALDPTEPVQATAADGTFQFNQLDPGFYRVRLLQQAGWAQVFPAETPPATPDGYADRVVSFIDSGTGPIPGPYGKKADPLPGVRVVLGLEPEPVDVGIILHAPPPPPLTAPISAFAHVDWLSLPKDSEVTVAFDGEEIIDGPGADLVIHTEGHLEETAELYLGSTESNLTYVTTFSSSSDILIDLGTLDRTEPIRYVRIKALDLLGSYPGIEILGYEALHYRVLPRGHYDVTVQGGSTIRDIDFGVIGNDRPPRVFVSLSNPDPRAGEPFDVQVTASDDVALASTTLLRDGTPVPLNANLEATLTAATGGLLELAAIAEDVLGQTAQTLLPIVVRNADGTRPDLSGYGIPDAGASGGPVIQIASPAPGEILEAPTDILGTIRSTTAAVAAWQVHFALASLVNPESLGDGDPDYTLLAEGTGPVSKNVLGRLGADTLTPGAYLIRVSATDIHGTTAYHGFVVGVRVDPLDIRPGIVLQAPDPETAVTFITNLVGTISTRDTLREWYVEYAPLSEIHLGNLADPATGAAWKRIAQGTNSVTVGVLARFDPTLLANDTYVLRVSAWNRNGLGWAEPLVLHVNGNAKIGSFVFETTDLQVPLAGIPITLRRIYESVQSGRSSDFGYGWRMAFQDADVRETVPQTGTGFLSTPFRVGARVYLNAPDGSRIGFTFQPEIGTTSLLGPAWRAVFTPDPGVRYSLAVPEAETPFLSIDESGNASLFFIALPWNPDVYILTDNTGTRYTGR